MSSRFSPAGFSRFLNSAEVLFYSTSGTAAASQWSATPINDIHSRNSKKPPWFLLVFIQCYYVLTYNINISDSDDGDDQHLKYHQRYGEFQGAGLEQRRQSEL